MSRTRRTTQLSAILLVGTASAAAQTAVTRNDLTTQGTLERRQYKSVVDGANIYYAVWYPESYDEAKSWPLIVFLHGSGEGGGWGKPTEPKNSIPVRTIQGDLEFVVVFPLMRGTWSINGPAERDVLDTIEDVKRHASIDPDRIHLTGISLGGFAAWSLASHYPHLFASLSVFAAGGQPEEVVNLRNLPTWVFHGTADPHVPIQESERMVQAMEKAGISVKFEAMPGVDHTCWRQPYAGDALFNWMAGQRVRRTPNRISYRTRSLRHNNAYWATIDSMVDPAQPAFIDLFVPDGKTVFVHTENVGRLTLAPPAGVLKADAAPSFIVNDKPANAMNTDGTWVLEMEPTDSPTDESPAQLPNRKELRKRHGLSGPIQDALYEPFVIVTPGTASEQVNREWREIASKAFQWKEHLTYEKFDFITDANLSEGIIASHNLICFGDPSNNLILARITEQLPISHTSEGIMMNGAPLPTIAALVMIYPNPLNPERYVVVCSGHPQAIAPLAAAALQPPYLAPTPLEDLVIMGVDGSLLLAEETGDSPSERKWMASSGQRRGLVFDRWWRIPTGTRQRLANQGPEPAPSPPGVVPGD